MFLITNTKEEIVFMKQDAGWNIKIQNLQYIQDSDCDVKRQKDDDCDDNDEKITKRKWNNKLNQNNSGKCHLGIVYKYTSQPEQSYIVYILLFIF